MQRMQSDAQGKKFSAPPKKKTFSSSSRTLGRFLDFPLVSRSLSFYDSFKTNHRIISFVLGIIEWFYAPYFRRADRLLTYAENKVDWGRSKASEAIDIILYYPILLTEGPLVYYVESLAQFTIIRKAFELIDNFTDQIVPVEYECDVSDYRYEFFQNLETNFPFLRKMRRKVNTKALWGLPINLFYLSKNYAESFFSTLSYVFYLLFIQGSPQEKARYIRPKINSRKLSLGPVSSFSAKTIPIISVTPPPPSAPKSVSSNAVTKTVSGNTTPKAAARKSKPIPQNLKKNTDFPQRKQVLNRGTSLRNFLIKEESLGKLPRIQEEPEIQITQRK
eukprot:TRINITY_DN3253_c0_g1_i2.p1 TRINITY_DN3253_c0_g1~~TRINITY_DN3253_c0_g1_i2.p1  ORF type:complete len:333 (-),score=48.85 TRINITY_DN3253_c0_g1_i2:92-1090(-)